MIYLHDIVGSTNDLALNAENPEHGDMWIADQQTAGRGRREGDGDRRSWFSPRGTGFYGSVLLKPNVDTADASAITIAAGVAVCQVLQSYGMDVWLKWPNDVYVGDKKIAGILTEAATNYGMLDRIVVGVGINLSLQKEDVPPDLRETITSVAIETEQVIDRLSLAYDLHGRLLQLVDAYARGGLGSLSSFIARFDRSKGRTVKLPDGREAKAQGISETGSFDVEIEGAVEQITSGEILFID